MIPEPHGGRLATIPDVPDAYSGDANVLDVSYETAVTITDMKVGILSPLSGFVDESQYLSIIRDQRLPDGTPWSIPQLLTVRSGSLNGIVEGDQLALRNNGRIVGVMEISQIFHYQKKEYVENVFGTSSPEHPGVMKIMDSGDAAVAGRLIYASMADLPFSSETLFPADTRKMFREKGWKSVSAFQTRNVPHRGHEEIQRLSLRSTDALFINPVIGRKKKGDYTDETIMKAYSTLVSEYYPHERVVLTPLHYEMMYAGPREAVMHAIMRKNYGCSHFIVGRDHAGVGSFYGPYDAQENLASFDDLGITIVPFEETFYCRKCEQLVTARECSHPESMQEKFSGTKIRGIITSSGLPPPQVMRREVYSAIRSMKDPFVR